MKKCVVLLGALFISWTAQAQFGKLPPFTRWHQNPLSFQPLKLHTSNAIIIPGLAAGFCLWLTQRDTSLAKQLSWFEEVGYAKAYNPSYTEVWQNNFGVLFQSRKWLSLGAEWNTYRVGGDGKNDTWGFGLRPFVRFYPLNRGRLRLYFESGAGVMYFLEKFPQPSGFFGDSRTGTNWNGSPKYGFGAEWQVSERLSVQASWRHVHVSNGNAQGTENNPGHDSNGANVGLIWQARW